MRSVIIISNERDTVDLLCRIFQQSASGDTVEVFQLELLQKLIGRTQTNSVAGNR